VAFIGQRSGEPFKGAIFHEISKDTIWRIKYTALFQNSGSPPFSEDEIQGLFQDFQGPFSVYSRTWQLEKSLKISFATQLLDNCYT
jgi:hypothetical protein